MRPVTVRLYDTIERGAELLAQVAINARITALSMTSTIPGGFNTLSVGMAEPTSRSSWGPSYAFIPEPVATKPFAHVLAQVGSAVVFEGRLVEDEIGPSGLPQAFVADGYGLAATNLAIYRSSDESQTTTGEIIADMINRAARLLRRETGIYWTDPGVQHSRSEFDEMTLAEALDQVLKEGGTDYVTWDWWVYEGRRLALLPRATPATPDYLIPYRPGEVTIRRNFRDIATTAYVAYTSSNVEFETASETRDRTVHDFRMSRGIRISGDELSTSAATQLRSTELERRGAPETSISIARGPADDDWLTASSGAPVPHWLVRAGQWVQVADMEPQIIVNCSYDPEQGLSLDLGAPSRRSFAVYLAQTCAEVNKLAKGINPVTGGRRRSMRQGNAVAALTNAFGTYDGVIADVGASHSQTILNANFRDLSDSVNSLRSELVAAKILP